MLATLYVACADPPKKINKGSGGAPGTAGMRANEAGEAGEAESAGADSVGGNGGSAGKGGASDGGAAGEAGAGEEGGAAGASGAGPVDPCTLTTVGGQSKIPAGPKTGVAKPNGAVGGFSVVNWAGFKGALSYTFDDSLQSQVTHYEALNAVGIHVTFYLVPFNQGSNPIWVKAVADGHELGNHTMNHCNANGTGCTSGGTSRGQDAELDDNTTFLMGKAGVTGVYSFASPFGDINWTEAASKRFLLTRGVSDGSILPNDGTNPMSLPCHVSNGNPGGETAIGGFNVVSDDVRAKGSWRTILMHNVDPDINDYGYNPVKFSEVVDAMTYTKNLGDVWADTVTAIGSYWRAQKTLSVVKPQSVGNDQVYSWTLPAHFPPGQYVRATVTGGKVKQCGTELTWDDHGYYEINLDAGSVTISP
ncbi:MAG TPA: polysaccharide deacetylase family protein [Polyangiaceae bacterium]|nr:polysaccharide deacetylase family protein [Polyangiaceae bacterium]